MHPVNDILALLSVSSSQCEGWWIGREGWNVLKRITFDIAGDPELAREFGLNWSDFECDWFVLLASIYGEGGSGILELYQRCFVRCSGVRKEDGIHRGEIEIA